MKRNPTTRLLSIILALLFALCTMPTASAATTPYRYVALGDSIAAGDMLSSESQSYVNKLSGLIGASSTVNRAKSGMSSGEVLALLGDAQVRSAIERANLVTVSAGCADVLGVFLALLDQAVPDRNYQAVLADPAKLAAVKAMLTSPQAGQAFSAAVQGAAASLPQIAAAIHEINPSAALVFTSGYNPYHGFAIPGDAPFDLGALVDPVVAALNQAMAATLPGEIIVDLESAFRASGAPICVNASLFPTLDFDPHPNAAGHSLIAQLIYKKVDTKFPVIKVPARVGIISKKLTVYKKPGKNKMFELAKDSSVVIFSWDGQYAKIGFNNGYGYIKTAALTMIPLLDEPTKRMNVRSKVVVRDEPNKKGKKQGTVYPRNQLVAYGTSGKWTKVQIGTGIGYVETKQLAKAK